MECDIEDMKRKCKCGWGNAQEMSPRSERDETSQLDRHRDNNRHPDRHENRRDRWDHSDDSPEDYHCKAGGNRPYRSSRGDQHEYSRDYSPDGGEDDDSD